MSNEITPAPWVVNKSDEARGGFGGIRVESEHEHGDVNDGWCIAEFSGPDAPHNARLSAAAPELLEALNGLLTSTTTHMAPRDQAYWIATARAAIAKATGEEENE